MGKSAGKYREKVPMQVVLDAISTAPIKDVLRVAKSVCNTDYAIMGYRVHKNDEAVRHAVRRAFSIGAFDHRARIIQGLGLDEAEAPDYLRR